MALKLKKKNRSAENGTESEASLESVDEELEKNRLEEVKYAKFNLSVLDPDIEKNFDARDYLLNMKKVDTAPVVNTHPMGLDPTMRASQDSDLRMASSKLSHM